MTKQNEPREVPVKLYWTSDLVTVAVPMPGLDPGDVTAEITPEGRLRVRGALSATPGSGALEDRESKAVLLEEWTVGPYHRDLQLPAPVDGPATVVTYGNGVVVVAMPLADHTRPATLTATRGDGTTGR